MSSFRTIGVIKGTANFRVPHDIAWISVILICAVGAMNATAQKRERPTPPAAADGQLTVDRIYSQPSLGGHTAEGLAWSPDGKQLSFFESRGSGKEEQKELWAMDAATGQRRLLVAAEKLLTILPAVPAKANQSTGLGRIAPSQYQWAPGGAALLFASPQSLTWFDLKTQTPRTLASGKDELADAKISPDGRSVSFVRDHNIWIVDVASGKERSVTVGGSEELRKGELDWVYPEELEISTAYWWAPDSSAIAYLEMDESKVNEYPLVDFASYSGEADEERYPIAGGSNPTVHVYVANLNGAAPQLMDTGADTDIYLPRVNWLRDAKHLAIQRLNRAQTELDLLVAEGASGNSHVLLHEKDLYWINLGSDLYFLKDGKRFLWSSERSGYRHFYLYDLAGNELAQLTKGEWEVTGLEGVDESKGVAVFLRHRKIAAGASSVPRRTRWRGVHAHHQRRRHTSSADECRRG